MLTNRQTLLLQIIVDEFIRSAQPIGSQFVSKKQPFQVSSATIRNEMADLEDMGFIEKTHTSSGRIPSQKGYRYYVDHLLMPKQLRKEELNRIQSIFSDRMNEIEKVVQNSALILSELTDYTSIVLGPNFHEHKLKRIQFIEVDPLRVIAILITDGSHIENRVFNLMKPIKATDLERMSNFLNERLQGVPLSQLYARIPIEMNRFIQQHVEHVSEIMERLSESFGNPLEAKLFIGGKSNLIRQPEFHDIGQIQKLLTMIEKEDRLYEILRSKEDGISIQIGKENIDDAMENCSLITATYSFGENQVGTIAILGPTRMDYARVIKMVQTLSEDLGNTMRKHYSK